jgi:hypothetical protein
MRAGGVGARSELDDRPMSGGEEVSWLRGIGHPRSLTVANSETMMARQPFHRGFGLTVGLRLKVLPDLPDTPVEQ